MDRDSAKQIILASLPNYLAQKGIDPSRKFLCLNPEHQDHSPSMHYDRRRNRCHCFSCGCDVDVFNLIQWDYNTDSFKDTFGIACDLFGLTVESRKDKQKEKPKIKPAQKERTRFSEIKKAAPEICDKVYRTMQILSPLTDADVRYLEEKRGLSKERSKKDYLRMVTAPEEREKLVRKLSKLTGYTKDVLKYVPGFFIDKKTGKLDYSGDNIPSVSHGTRWCNNAGIGILIHDADGYAVAIQIRRDTANKGNRYCWFTSIFAVDNDDYDGGSTPGAAKDIIIPDNPRNCLCITEGRFKSEILAANRNIVISIQGVSAWKGVDEIIGKLREERDIKSIYLMFDSDIMGNRQVFNTISDMARTLAERIPDLKINFAVWKIEYGKGIDDCILAGNISHVKYVDAKFFMDVCNNTFNMLLKKYNVESFRKMSAEDRKEFKKILQKENEKIIFNKKQGEVPKEAA